MSKKLGQLIAGTLQGHGHEALFAGGCVRDTLLGREPKDWDIATSATPDEVIELLDPKVFRILEIGKSFGVLKVLLNSNTHDIGCEVATFREEDGYVDGRRPTEIAYSKSAFKDAARRDFTINAMYMDPLTEKITDYFGGQNDLRRRRIQTVGDPEKRFSEDYLRMLRAIRFSADLDCQLPGDLILIIKSLASRINKISAERKCQEFERICKSYNPRHGLALLSLTGLMGHMFNLTPLTPSNLAYFSDTREAGVAPILVKMFENTTFSEARRIMEEMKLHKYIPDVMNLLMYVYAHRSMVRPFCVFLAAERCRDIPGALSRVDSMYKFEHRVYLKGFCLGFQRTITGDVLIRLGYPKGPLIGEIIKAAEEAEYNGEFRTHLEGVNWVKSRYSLTTTNT
jgi:tRNA nucleotidyltransferase/poly(A) polymerase